jgi:Putative addiction module component
MAGIVQEETMSTNAKELCEKAKELPDIEKLILLDALLAQLDRPDPELDQVWAEEAQRRRQAYREGRLKARDYEEVMGDFPRP